MYTRWQRHRDTITKASGLDMKPWEGRRTTRVLNKTDTSPLEMLGSSRCHQVHIRLTTSPSD